MPPSDAQGDDSWVLAHMFSLLGQKIFHDFSFFETMTGNYYFAGIEILSRLHKQTACNFSRRRLCSLTQSKSQFPCRAFSWPEKKGTGSCLADLDYIIFQVRRS